MNMVFVNDNELMGVDGGYVHDGSWSSNGWVGGSSRASDFPPAPQAHVGAQFPPKVGVQVGTDGWRVDATIIYWRRR